MRAGSVFSGIGGGDLGMEAAGIETVFQIENAKFPRRVLEARWPGVERHGDVTRVGAGELPAVDVLHGGFPCQDLSVAGRRAGLAGERSGLFHEFARLAAALRPRWVIIENVPGLRSSQQGQDLGIVLGVLANLGYGWAYRSLDAQYFGLAQRRERVFIVGCLGDAARAAAVLFEPESGGWDTAPSRETGTDVAFALRKHPGGVGQGWNTNHVVASLSGMGNGGPDDNDAQANRIIAHPLTAEGHDASEDGTVRGAPLVVHPRQDPITSDKALPLEAGGTSAVLLRMREGKEGGGKGPLIQYDRSGTLATANDQTLFAINDARPLDGTSEHAVAAPLRTNDRNNSDGVTDALSKIYTPYGVRKLTPLECERLQGFPDGWTCLCPANGVTADCVCPDSPRYKALGNAIAVPVMAWITKRIKEVN